MDSHFLDLVNQAIRTLAMAIVPTFIVSVAAFVFSLLQGMLAVREESMQYAVRALALVLVVVVFGATAVASCLELMRFALR
jgi:flagellar biosynthesis protein FliQ